MGKTSKDHWNSMANRQFAFAISLSVLNHPGRSLYRSFATGKDPLKEAALSRDAKKYKPIRDAVAHKVGSSDGFRRKKKLTSVRENIRGRVKKIQS
jgi:hypothetical protein